MKRNRPKLRLDDLVIAPDCNNEECVAKVVEVPDGSRKRGLARCLDKSELIFLTPGQFRLVNPERTC